MATYLSVSNDIAERIASGGVATGDELPSIREAAQRHDTTATTVARAYRYLDDAGVIDVSDRRGSRVATGGCAAAAKMLAGSAALRLAGSDDPGLDVALRSAGASVATVGERGSFHGLTRIWQGTADAAAIHLPHRSGTPNSPFAPTNLLYSVVATPGAIWRYRRQGQTGGPLTRALLAGTRRTKPTGKLGRVFGVTSRREPARAVSNQRKQERPSTRFWLVERRFPCLPSEPRNRIELLTFSLPWRRSAD